MKRLVFVLLASALLLASGCSFPESYPIEKEQNILIAGVDVEGENIVLTVLVDSVSAGGQPGEEKVQYKLYQAAAKTIYEADEMLHQTLPKRPSWYHTKYIILGEEAAKSGVDRLFNFFSEDDETRLLYRIAVTQGMTAKDFLSKANTGKSDLADYFDTLFAAADRTGKSREIHLINFAPARETGWVSVYMPVLKMFPNPVSSGGSDSGGSSSGGSAETMVMLNGFALFDEDKLVGFLSGDISRGLNFITNDVKGSSFSVKDKDGNGVGLELMQSKAEIKPSYDPLSAVIEINVQSNLVEYHLVSPMNEQDVQNLEQQQNELICNEVAQAIKRMQELKSDPAHIMDTFYHSDPVKWQQIKGDWKNIFANLNITVKVNSKVLNTYELREAIGKES